MEAEGTIYKNYKKLETAKDARQYMQQVINSYDKNEISQTKARTLGYLIKVFLDTYQLSDLQERLEELEEMVKGE